VDYGVAGKLRKHPSGKAGACITDAAWKSHDVPTMNKVSGGDGMYRSSEGSRGNEVVRVRGELGEL